MQGKTGELESAAQCSKQQEQHSNREIIAKQLLLLRYDFLVWIEQHGLVAGCEP
jgi:hypothetical protein